MNVILAVASALLLSVDLFVGTDGKGNVTPAATVPFGMVQPGPDTSACAESFAFDVAHSGGYRHPDGFLWHFSQTHLSGMGSPCGGNVGILPVTAAGVESAAIVKSAETAEPGYYAVTLGNGVRCEVTALLRTAVYRFTYPAEAAAGLLFDLDWALMMPASEADDVTKNPYAIFRRAVRGCKLKADDATHVRGFQNVRCYVDQNVRFAAEFSAPVCERTLVREADGVRGETWRLDFGKIPEGVLEIRLALSYRSEDAAVRNLAGERRPFEAVRAAAARAWADWFARIDVEASADPDRLASFRVAQYRLAVQPNRADDLDENAERYVNFSLWDTFRAAHPAYTILAPERVDAFVNSLLDEYDSFGYLPILSVFGRDTHCMIGHHSAPVIADAWLKGFRGFDPERAMAAMNDTYRREHTPESGACWGFLKEDWRMLDQYGYYPFDVLHTSYRHHRLCGESVSRTLECAYDDACVARFAAATGHAADADYFRRRAGNWTNVFDRAVGFARGRDSAGRWREPFDPALIGFGPFAERDFTEGNSWQYTWHVMHDPEGLVQALGGRQPAGERLDRLFAAQVGMGKDDRSYAVTGLVGQYAHGNEISHHVAYFYAYTDRPWRTADVVREVVDTLYRPRPDGLCGNDDCGQMSAWYVFSVLGFYPFDPCGGTYVLGAPQVPRAVVRLPEGRSLEIIADGLSAENKYVRAAYLNGRRIGGRTISHADIMKGGRLAFEMVGSVKGVQL